MDWINVKKRRPEKSGYYKVKWNNNGVPEECETRWNDLYGGYFEMGQYRIFVTHWKHILSDSDSSTEGGCICQHCHNRFKVDLNIPDNLWSSISNGDSLLCGSCIMARIEALGNYGVIYGSTEIG